MHSLPSSIPVTGKKYLAFNIRTTQLQDKKSTNSSSVSYPRSSYDLHPIKAISISNFLLHLSPFSSAGSQRSRSLLRLAMFIYDFTNTLRIRN